MKRTIVLILTILLFLCGCSSQSIDLKHSIVQTDFRIDVQYPHIQVFRSFKEMEAYSKSLAEGFKYLPDNHFTHDSSFVDSLERYNMDYFRNHILIIATISAPSGGDRFAIDGITKTDNNLTIRVKQTQIGMTCDMAAWHILLELDSSYDTDSANIKVEIME